MAFPVDFTGYINGPPGVGTEILAEPFNAVEEKLGVDGSEVVSSIDYLLKHPESLDPGHKHDHGGLQGLDDDDHPQYILHSLAAAASDFLVASGAGAFVKKSLAETKAILELPASPYVIGDLFYASSTTVQAKLAAVAVNQVLVSGGVGAPPAWSGTPTLAGITCTAINPLTTAAESWIGPSSTAGIYFKGGNVGIGTTSPSNLFHVGSSVSNPTNTTPTLRVGGQGISDGAATVGNYGSLILNASTGYTGGARRYLLTNTLGANKFAIIRSVDSSTDPAIGVAGAITSGTADFVLDNAGNVGLGATAFGTSANKVLGIGSGTAPTSFPADMAQMCVKDQAVGNACFHFYTELGQIIKLYQQAALTTALTGITHTAPGTPDYALQDLVQNTGFGFATADEGNSLLAVVANLQTRVGELATILANNGLTA